MTLAVASFSFNVFKEFFTKNGNPSNRKLNSVQLAAEGRYTDP
jgi:hypothetical protein